jgi:hypothetical protein
MLDLREFQTIQNLSVANRFIAGNFCDSLGSGSLGVK